MIGLTRRKFLRGTVPAAVLFGTTSISRGDQYPSKPIRMVIPFAAGGANDQIAHPWADKMGSLLGPVYIQNLGGAGGAVGCTAVAHAVPDGYSLLLGNIGNQALIPLASSNAGYDSIRDFRAIYHLVTTALAFAVHPSLPAHTLQELVAYAKANPGKLSYGTAGAGTSNHLAGEMFKLQSGATDIVHVPYRGAGPAIIDLVSGQVPMVIAVMSGQLLQLSQSGQVRIIAVTTEKRLNGAPNIPTASESGMQDLTLEGWFGLFAPKATPDAVVNRVAEATQKAMTDPALLESYRSQAMEPDTDSSPEKFQQMVKDQVVRLAAIIKSTGFKVD